MQPVTNNEDLMHIARGYAINYARVYPTGNYNDDEMLIATKTDYALDVMQKAMDLSGAELVKPLAMAVLDKGKCPAWHDEQMAIVQRRAPILFGEASRLVGYFKKYGAKK